MMRVTRRDREQLVLGQVCYRRSVVCPRTAEREVGRSGVRRLTGRRRRSAEPVNVGGIDIDAGLLRACGVGRRASSRRTCNFLINRSIRRVLRGGIEQPNNVRILANRAIMLLQTSGNAVDARRTCHSSFSSGSTRGDRR
jgi:hypothetical protein